MRWFSVEAVRSSGCFELARTVADQEIVVYSQSVGTTLFIVPWNVPFSIGARQDRTGTGGGMQGCLIVGDLERH